MHEYNQGLRNPNDNVQRGSKFDIHTQVIVDWKYIQSHAKCFKLIYNEMDMERKCHKCSHEKMKIY